MTDHDRTQERVFAFLTEPAAHPHVRRIDTHAASVFLEGARALKIKRAVRFPFLDYSTLERRKAACDDEIRINRQFAPQIYRRVVPITEEEDGSLEIGGHGAPIEFAIEMARFDERKTLDNLAAAGPLDHKLVEAIGDCIAASHRVAAPARTEPWLKSIPGIIAGNSTAFCNSGRFAPADINELDRASSAAFRRLLPLLENRGSQGYVRRCHGDLHLANIVLIEDKPVLFDAIEFDSNIASIDALYDLAFTIMDLLHYGRTGEANALLNRYLMITPTENLDGLAALPLYMSMRAGIRAHVLLARVKSADPDISGAASAYFDLARLLIDPREPILIAIGGLSGTGKTVTARELAPAIAPQPGAIIIRSDVLRKQMFGVNEAERLPPSAYQAEINARVYDQLLGRAATIIAQGHSVILDAVFAQETERALAAETARKLNRPFLGLFLAADLATRQSRIAGRESDASDATAEVAAVQQSYNIGTVDWAVIDASGTPEQTLKPCQTRISEQIRRQ
jgi:uncharacterized protein